MDFLKVKGGGYAPCYAKTAFTDDRMDYSQADKKQHPVKRVGRPMDIARAVLFLCNGDNGFITGQNITVDGGMTRLMIYSGDNGWEYQGD